MIIGTDLYEYANTIKINLPQELQGLLQTKACKFGVPLTQYVKHVLMKDVEEEQYPTYEASEETERRAKKAMKELPHLKPVKNLKQYLKSL